MNILPVGQHLDCLLPLGQGDLLQGQQTQHRLRRLTVRGKGRETDRAWLVKLLSQLLHAEAVGIEEFGELVLEGGADGRGYWRRVNLEKTEVTGGWG